MSADLDIVSYLVSKGIRTFPANGSEVTAHCFFDCTDGDPRGKGKLYINIEEGMYHCKRCGAQGGTYLLQKHFGDDPRIVALPGTDPATRRKILEQAAEVGSEMLLNQEDVLLWLLNERGLSPETVVERRLGFVGHGWSLTGCLPGQFSKEELRSTGLVYRDGLRADQDFLYNHLLIPYQSRGSVVQVRGRIWGESSGGKYMTGPGDAVRIYNSDDLDGADTVILTEGEFDTMVLKQHLSLSPEDSVRDIAVVGLAGVDALPTNFESYFSEAKKVYIGFDPDTGGRRAAIKIKELLGTKARILELPPELPKCDWSEYLVPVPENADGVWHAKHPHAGHTWRDVVGLLGSASGKRLFTLSEAGHSWRLFREQTKGQGLKTGYSQLDATVLPGMLPGQVCIILAKSGTGKTILLCNMAYYQRNRRVLFLSLEMTREEVYERLRRIYLFHHPTATDVDMEAAFPNLMICDENRIAGKDFNNLIDEYEIETGVLPDAVYVDYLGYFARGQRGGSQYEKMTSAVMELKAMAKGADPRRRFVIIAPAQVNRSALEGKPIDMDDARDSGAIEETADFLLSIFKPDDALQHDSTVRPSGKLRLTVLKSRHGGKGRVFSLMFDPLSLVIVDDLTAESKRAEENNYAHWRGVTWEEWRAEQTAPRQLSVIGSSA